MDEPTNKDILNAVSGVDERVTELTAETRSGYEKIDTRLTTVEDEVKAVNTTLDTLIEGDTLGTGTITLTREEYDAMVTSLHLPNRYAHDS